MDGRAPVKDETVELNGPRFHYRDWGNEGARCSSSSTPTQEELDAAIRTLPNFPLIQNMTVTPLIRHPVEEAYEEEYGPMPPL
jgi:muconolactone delta-isomerase